MAFGAPTTISAILLACQNKLVVTDDIIPLERCVISLADKLTWKEDPPADQYLVLVPRQGAAIQPLVSGGGLQQHSQVLTLGVELYNRVETDWTLSDVQAITGATLGIVAFWQSVLGGPETATGLDLFTPLNNDGACILIEPMRLLTWTLIPRRMDESWVVWDSNFELKYNSR